MTISRDDVLLADRFPDDESAYRAQKAKVARIRGEEWEALQKKHKDRLAGEEGKLHRLAGAMRQSGEARQALEVSVAREIQDAVSFAERDLRALDMRGPSVVGSLNNAKAALDRLVKGKAIQPAISGQKKAVLEIERELSAMKSERKRLEERLVAAREAFRLAVDAIRKDALVQEE